MKTICTTQSQDGLTQVLHSTSEKEGTEKSVDMELTPIYKYGGILALVKRTSLTLLILLSAFQLIAQPMGGEPLPYFETGGIRYETTGSNTVKVSASGNYFGNMVIPASTSNNGTVYTVTSIGNSAFETSSITGITLPNTLISIGTNAFAGNTLGTINLPTSLTTIADYAFSTCMQMSNITLPASVSSIGIRAFNYCSSFTSINIPSSVTSIGDGAWYECTGLQSIYCYKSNPLTITTNVFYNVNKSTCTLYVPVGTKSLYQAATGWKDFSKIVEMSTAVGTEFTNIGIKYQITGANAAKVIKGGISTGSITIPASVNYLSTNFNITAVGDSVFMNCTGLTALNLASGIESIGNYALYFCTGLTGTLTLPSSLKTIGDGAINSCSNLTNLTIPETVTSIGDGAFVYCQNIPVFHIPASVTHIGARAFYDGGKFLEVAAENPTYSSLEGVLYDKGKTVLMQCPAAKTDSVIIPETVKTIGEVAFSGCHELSKIKLPSGLDSIGYAAFSGCSSISKLAFPASLRIISDNAFQYCGGLMAVTSYTPAPLPLTSWSRVFTNVLTDYCTLIVKPGTKSLYQAATIWNEFTNIQEMGGTIGNTYTVNGINYKKITATSVAVVHGSYTGSIIIPAKVNIFEIDLDVTAVGDSAFYNNRNLSSVALPSTITTIGNHAFDDCRYLESVNIPSSVTSIGRSAFYNCYLLSSITIPSSVTSIGNNAFSGCLILQNITIPSSISTIEPGTFYVCQNLKSVTLPSTITSIGGAAFYGCMNLPEITIPESVTTIGVDAFYNCSKLVSVHIPASVTSIGRTAFLSSCKNSIDVDANNTQYSGLNGILYDKGKTVLIQCPTAKADSVIIPETVKTIAEKAFFACTQLTKITLPSGLDSIGSEAFASCYRVPKITLPASLRAITYGAFEFCSGLNTITACMATPISLSSYSNVFTGVTKSSCTLKVISGTKNLYQAATLWKDFVNIQEMGGTIGTKYTANGLNYKVLDNTKVAVAQGTYSGNISIPAKVTIQDWEYNVSAIGDSAFYNCTSLTNIIIPTSVTLIGDYAFSGCSSLINMNIPNSVTSIGHNAFSYCRSLINMNIPNSVTSIGNQAFYNCTSLESITIPNSVKSIGYYAFSGCSSLINMNIPNSVTSIRDYAFNYCTSLKSITIPSSVTSIGDYAFYYCTSLESISIPNSVTSIGGSAFSDCHFLSSITLSNSLTSISSYIFRDCSNLKSITIPSLVSSIGNYAFYGCTSLASINIPSSVKSIGDGVFEYCSGLKSITIPSGVTSIAHYAFYGSALTKLNIPSSVTFIGMAAFRNCRSLTSINIPTSVTTIGDDAFVDCYSLRAIYAYPYNPVTINTTTFSGVSRASCKLYVRESALAKYRQADVWKDFQTIEKRTYGGIQTDNVRELTSREISIPVKSAVVFEDDYISAYQFELKYDPIRLKYKSYNTDTLMTSSGSVIVNSNTPGVLKVGYMSDEYLRGEGSLINLQFSLHNSGVTTPDFTKFLMNSTRTDSIRKGSIEIIAYGDVDYNQEVQSYDASLALIKSVGLNPLPVDDPLPWEALRMDVADVDGNHSVTAYDAGLILKKSVDLIDSFPAEKASLNKVPALRKVQSAADADVTATLENSKIVFRSYGNLVGLNLSITGDIAMLDKPLISSSMIQAKNINTEGYKVALATATSPTDGTTIMTIPLKSNLTNELILNMIVNSQEKVISINNTVTAVNPVSDHILRAYLDATTNELHFAGLQGKCTFNVLNMNGTSVFKGQIPENGLIKLESIAKGIYLVNVTEENGLNTILKIIKS